MYILQHAQLYYVVPCFVQASNSFVEFKFNLLFYYNKMLMNI